MADKKISALTSASTPLAGTEVLPIVQSGSTVKVEVNDMLETISVTSPAVNSEGNIFLRATDALAAGVGTQIGLGGKYNASSYFPFGGISARKENSTNNNVAGYTDILTTTSGGTLTARMRFNSTGDGTLLNGNFVVGTAGKGIDFSANANAPGMSSELLNWYETGTWTPVIGGQGSAGVGTYTTQVGRYTRIGNAVHFTAYVVWTAHTGTGGMYLDGLPFASSATANQFSQYSPFSSSLAYTANSQLQLLLFSNSTNLLFYEVNGGAAAANVNVDAAGDVIVSGTYFV